MSFFGDRGPLWLSGRPNLRGGVLEEHVPEDVAEGRPQKSPHVLDQDRPSFLPPVLALDSRRAVSKNSGISLAPKGSRSRQFIATDRLDEDGEPERAEFIWLQCVGVGVQSRFSRPITTSGGTCGYTGVGVAVDAGRHKLGKMSRESPQSPGVFPGSSFGKIELRANGSACESVCHD
jgi:hypothetical protein